MTLDRSIPTFEEAINFPNDKFNPVKYNTKCSCKCSEHPEQDLIKEDYTGQGFCKLCNNWIMESDIDLCDYCTGRYDEFMELLGSNKLK